MAKWFEISVVSLLTIVVIVNASSICDKCSCFEFEDEDYLVSCQGYKNHIPDVDFEMLEWPKIENRVIKAFFNNIPTHLLPKIAGDAKVSSLNLDDNSIRTISSNPFEYFSNMETISLANNRISEITADLLKSQTKLKHLNISNNTISFINPKNIAHLKELEELNLSHNFLTKLSADFLEACNNVLTLRLENNKIYAIDNAYDKVDYKLRKIFLASNQFTVITSSMFEKITKLEYIDLSNNKISNIDENAFTMLTSLKLLDLSDNSIKRTVIRLPDTLELLTMANNNLISWPLLNIPEDLQELTLSQNNFEFIFPKDHEINSLLKLDVSRNLISFLPNTQLLNLEYLDLSFNLLTSVPQNLDSMTPLLKTLILDGNEIAVIEFTEKVTLGSISLSSLPLLRKIQSGAFSNVAGKLVTLDGTETCVDLKISHNENLDEVSEDAFANGLRLCHLDLSYNNLEKIPANLTDWTKIDFGFDLQGNPFSCDCEDEWMLDSILNTLYYHEDHQELLLELRCQSPPAFQGKRLIKFLNHKNPFCKTDEEEEKSSKIIHESGFGGFFKLNDSPSSNGDDKSFDLKPFSPGFIIIVSLSSVILILIIIVGVKWQRDQNRKFVRRNRLYYDDYDY